MKETHGKISDIKIAYIGGGSRAWARKLMCDLVLEESISGNVALYDINEEAARDNAVIIIRIFPTLHPMQGVQAHELNGRNR